MKKLPFDFTVDKSTHSILVTREFNAALPLVWDAFTNQEILDQWWAPKPWVSKTKSMELKEGGHRLYAMVGPEGEEHWSLEDYTKVNPKTKLAWISAFTDQDGNINEDFPTSTWELNFSEQNGTTTLRIVIQHRSLADIEMHIQMGFKEGFTMTLDELATLLS